jgi:hypothetical protein
MHIEDNHLLDPTAVTPYYVEHGPGGLRGGPEPPYSPSG